MTRQVIGVDVAKRKLQAGWLVDAQRHRIKPKAVVNTREGWQTLLEWAQRYTGASPEQLHFILEPTNVYHEGVAEYLHEAGAVVSLVNPRQLRDFARSLGVRSKTDSHDRRVLAVFGWQYAPQAWEPLPPEAKHLQQLLRRLDAVEADLQREQNRLETAEIQGNQEVIASHRNVIASLQEQRKRLRRQIDDHIDGHPQLRNDAKLLETIPGVGKHMRRELTALFAAYRFRTADQAAAYLGLHVVADESGEITKARPRLAKNGSARLRAKLYMPAIVAKRHNPRIHALYTRLCAQGKAKKTAIGAAMRKLIHIAFGVVKHQQPYDPQHA